MLPLSNGALGADERSISSRNGPDDPSNEEFLFLYDHAVGSDSALTAHPASSTQGRSAALTGWRSNMAIVG
jgi:hypothetical protein